MDVSETTVEQEKSLVQEAVGRAMTAWGGVEIVLAMLFACKLVGQRTNGNALAVFFAIENFRSKVQALESLFAAPSIPKDLSDRWSRTSKHLLARAKKRNEIAHHNIMVIESAKPGRRVLLLPPLLSPVNMERYDSGKRPGMCLGDIDAAISEFESVKVEVAALCEALEVETLRISKRR